MRQTLSSLTWGKAACIVAGATLGAILFSGLGLGLVLRGATERLTEVSATLLHRTEQQGQEVSRAFKILNTIKAEPCSEAENQAWRRLVFQSQIINDIGYQRHGFLLCTLTSGRLAAPLPLDKPDLETERGARVRLDATRPWAPDTPVTIVGQGNYSVALRVDALGTPMVPRDFSVASLFVNASSGRIARQAGAPVALPQSELVNGRIGWRAGQLFAVGCLPEVSTCHVLSASLPTLLSPARPVLLILALGGGLTGALGMVSVLTWQQQRRSLESRLRQALIRQELFVLYQPVVDAKTLRIVAAEALMRWELPDGSYIRPEIFVAIAEAGGFTGQIMRLAIQQVGRDLGDALRADADFRVTVNVAAGDLGGAPLMHALQTHFLDHGVHPSQVAIELTEQVSLETQAAYDGLRDLRSRGFQIYIDDFGTGYSSLSYLNELPVDAIKIDKSFTDLVGSGSPKVGVVAAMLAMAKSLSVAVIAEGVETEEQAAYFRAHDGAMLQGWLFGKPMSAADLVAARLAQESLAQAS
ncbi:EAL domain-containing protein [Microvirga antarctica]|uniref:EAL domain-containing protein n=1 Tax=Microvirga antarctica TaxID=2819233 RepID=UPI001B315CC8|nr:EAL domain-containing protein [Microvirga antarctica]